MAPKKKKTKEELESERLKNEEEALKAEEGALNYRAASIMSSLH
jgi:hypothetical protein